jgi:SprT-like family
MNSHPQLMRLFRKFNAKYFDGALPEPLIKYEHITTMKCFGLCDKADEQFIITIDPQWASTRAFRHITLLHEMIHIHIWPYASHGKRFQEETVRLALAGAYKEVL